MKRIFLAGNGPSLAETPWELLKGEDLMVLNKFGKIDDYYQWGVKPKYYFKVDHCLADLTPDLAPKAEITWAMENCEHLYLWDEFKDDWHRGNHDWEGVGDIPNTTWFPKCHIECRRYIYMKDEATTEWHLPELCTAFGGMSTMLQIASSVLDYDEIYVLGCDLGYLEDPTKNHAIPNYNGNGLFRAKYDTGNNEHLHAMAKRCSPIPIYNATIGGYLEVYERKDIYELLGEQ